MNKKLKVLYIIRDIIKYIILFEIMIILGLIVYKINLINNRLKQIEKDYKIYEINLDNLRKNKKVQF